MFIIMVWYLSFDVGLYANISFSHELQRSLLDLVEVGSSIDGVGKGFMEAGMFPIIHMRMKLITKPHVIILINVLENDIDVEC